MASAVALAPQDVSKMPARTKLVAAAVIRKHWWSAPSSPSLGPSPSLRPCLLITSGYW